jgi:signal transduction histidine kinase/CheY-like chemotaxis protein
MTTREPADFGIFRARRKDGSWRWFEGAGITYERADGELRLLGRAHDITERRRRELERQQLEEQMQQAQKLEGLGVMAGGIAHDFNNLLTPILGNASMALRDLPDVTAIRARLEKIQRATQRAAALTGQMLAYAGQGSLVIEPVDLSRLVREMGELLASAASGRAVLQYDLPSGLPTIEADAAQLTQVVMNLITNALEAVAEGEGAIEVRTGTVEASELTPVQMILGGELIAGTYVFFEVRDSGSGMSAETREKIFDPFFTTKFTGRGLGLAAVLGIVHSHRGAIEIDTEIGRGTRFRVFFPSAACLLAPTSPELLDSVEWRGSGTILVVDDDDGVRELMEQTLLRAGFAVLTAADGRTGIEVFRKYADSIRIVLLDRTMPLVSGEEALDAMRRIRPDACIVLVSGYSQEMAAEYFSGRGLAGFLQKPFIPLTLIARVRELLESD